MTNITMKDFSDIITSFHDPSTNTTSTWYRQTSNGDKSKSNSNSNLCLQCNSPRKNPNFHPFCGAICRGAWHAARAKDDKGSEKNAMLSFSQEFKQ